MNFVNEDKLRNMSEVELIDLIVRLISRYQTLERDLEVLRVYVDHENGSYWDAVVRMRQRELRELIYPVWNTD